ARSIHPREGAMFKFLGGVTTTRPWLVCACWLALGLGLTLAAPPWDRRSHDDDVHFLPSRCASVRGYALLERAFPQEVFASRLILAVERPSARLDDRDLALVDAIVADLARLRRDEPDLQILKVCSHRDAFIG